MSYRYMTVLFVGFVLVIHGVWARADSDHVENQLSVEQKLFGLSLFWKEVSYNFAHWETAGELDWDQAYQDFLPRILSTNNDFEYYQELQRFCALLKDGHTNVWMPSGLFKKYRDRIPLLMSEVDKHAIVRNVDVLLIDQIPVGTEILEIDDKPVRQMIEEDIMPLISTSAPHIYWETAVASLSSVGAGILFGPKGSSARLKIQKPDGQITTINVPRDHYHRKVTWAQEIPRKQLTEFEMLEGNIAYLALNDFSPEAIVDEFRARLPDLAASKGVILDLRRNGGGNSNNSSAIVGHFTPQPFKGAAWRTPINDGVFKAWGKAADQYESLQKYRDYYYGHVYRTVEATEHLPSEGLKIGAPTIVLIGRKTASAAEDFLIMADEIEHVTYMGEPTHGSTGQPLSLELPGGGKARISAKRDFYPDGREFIGRGIQPDVMVQVTVDDLREGRDVVKQTAHTALLQLQTK